MLAGLGVIEAMHVRERTRTGKDKEEVLCRQKLEDEIEAEQDGRARDGHPERVCARDLLRVLLATWESVSIRRRRVRRVRQCDATVSLHEGGAMGRDALAA